MKIVQICKKIPYPATDGESVAIWDMTKAILAAGNRLHLICLQTDNKTQKDIGFKHPLFSYTIVKKPLNIIWYKLIYFDLFTKTPYIAQRFISKKTIKKIVSEITDFKPDIVQIENLYMAFLIPNLTYTKIVVRTHNIEADIWLNRAKNENQALKKLYFNFLSKKLRQYEIKTLSQAHSLICISENEKKYFTEKSANQQIISLSTSIKPVEFAVTEVSIDFLFLGSLDWYPNIEALNWLAFKIWPKLRNQLPDAKWHMAGKNPSKKDAASWNSIPQSVFYGEISDLDDFYQKGSIVFVPLFTGSGIRIKILEAMSRGKAIVCTPQAVKGLDLKHAEHLLIAQNEAEFTEYALELYKNEKLRQKLQKNGAAYLQKFHSPEKLSHALQNQYKKLLAND